MKILSILALSLIEDINAGPKKKLERRKALAKRKNKDAAFDKESIAAANFNYCGNFTSTSGVLESEHPYKPETRCKWFITTPPGTKIKLTLLNLDIEEERSDDGPKCSNVDITLPNCDPPLETESCEWDYLEILAEKKEKAKICALVDRNRKFFRADSKFLEYDYDDEGAIPYDFLYGKELETNNVEIRFVSDEKAEFYGFRLKWEIWEHRGCEGINGCDENADCRDVNDQGDYECSCKDGFEGDGFFCRSVEIKEETLNQDRGPADYQARFVLGGFDDDYSAKFISDDYSARYVPPQVDMDSSYSPDDVETNYDDYDYAPKARPPVKIDDVDYSARESEVMMSELNSVEEGQGSPSGPGGPGGPGGFSRPMVDISPSNLNLVTQGMMTISPPSVETMPYLIIPNNETQVEKGFFPEIKTLNEDPVNYYINLQIAFEQATERILGGRVSQWKNRPFLVKKMIVRIKSTIKKTFFYVKGPCDVPLEDQTSGEFFAQTEQKVQTVEKLGELRGLFADFAAERFRKARCRGRSKKILGRINRLLSWAGKMSSR